MEPINLMDFDESTEEVKIITALQKIEEEETRNKIMKEAEKMASK